MSSSDGDDDEDVDEMMPRAFFVTGQLDTPPPIDPPMSGEDYLRRVRWEAKGCPSVVVSKIDPRQYDNKQTKYVTLPPACAAAPPGLSPSKEWEDHFVAYFSELRQSLNHLYSTVYEGNRHIESPVSIPHPNDARTWFMLCFGSTNDVIEETTITTTTSTEGESASLFIEEESSTGDANSPLLSIIFSLDQVSTIKLLDHHIQWFINRALTPVRSMWLFSILCRLEKPLDADVASSLRDLLRRLCLLRSHLSEASDPTLPPLNILITIITRYFGQRGD